MKKRILAILLCLCMAAALMSTAAWAEDVTEANAVAIVTFNWSETPSYYATFEEAWTAATANNVTDATVTLLKDVTVDSQLEAVRADRFTLESSAGEGETKPTLTLTKGIEVLGAAEFRINNINISFTGNVTNAISASTSESETNKRLKIENSTITAQNGAAVSTTRYDVEITGSKITSENSPVAVSASSDYNNKNDYLLTIHDSTLKAAGDNTSGSSGKKGVVTVDRKASAKITGTTEITATGNYGIGVRAENGGCVTLGSETAGESENVSVAADVTGGVGVDLRINSDCVRDSEATILDGVTVSGGSNGIEAAGTRTYNNGANTSVCKVTINGNSKVTCSGTSGDGIYFRDGEINIDNGCVTGGVSISSAQAATIGNEAYIEGGLSSNSPTTISGGTIMGDTALSVSGKTEITGEAMIEGVNTGIYVNSGAEVTVSAQANISATGSSGCGVTVTDGGTLNVTANATIQAAGTSGVGLNVNGGTAVLSAGKYVGIQVAGGTANGLLKNGYAYYKDGIRVDGAGNSINDTVTVEEAKTAVTLTLTAVPTNNGVKVTVSGAPADAVEGSVIAYCYKENDAENKKDVNLAKVSDSTDWALEVDLTDAGTYYFTAEYTGSETYDKAETAEPISVYFQGKRADDPIVTLTADKTFIVGSGTVTLTVTIDNPLQDGATIEVGYWDEENKLVPATKKGENTWTVELEDVTKTYQFTAEYTGVKQYETDEATWRPSREVSVEVVNAGEKYISITPSEPQLVGAGTVTLTVNMANMPDGGTLTVTCKDNENITATKAEGDGNVWTAELPAGEAQYEFVAEYTVGTEGDETYLNQTASCVVSVVNPEHQHVWASEWSMNNTHHWYDCTVSDCPVTDNSQKANYGEHTWNEGVETTAPTATTAGVKTFTCTACGQASTEPIPATGGSSSGSSGGGSSGGGSSNTTSSTTTNADGSTTTTTENKTTGTVTETTKAPDGSQTVVEIRKDGTVTTTETDKDGNKTETVEKTDGSSVTTVQQKDGTTASVTTDADGKVEAEVKLTAAAVTAAQESGEAVSLPIPGVQATRDTRTAPAVTVSTGSKEPVKVEIPTADVTPGTVAVLVNADGTEEIIKTSVPTADGVAVSLPDGATVKIVDNSKSFDDVSDAHWASGAVDFASARELFSGTGEASFSPEENMTRAMLMTVLARYDGSDTSGGETWYEKGMDWAVANGISDGSSPNSAITREQLAVMLYRYSGSPAAAGGLDGFSDADEISGYAQEAMRWAVENGIINGFGNGQLGPKALATRAQVAQMLKNFIEM